MVESDDDLEEYRPIKNTRMQVNNRFKAASHTNEQNTRSLQTLGNKMSPQKSGKGDELQGHNESQHFNLDNDGTSQFTYPVG